MKRDELIESVGREPLFTTGMLLGPGSDVADVRKQLSRWKADGTVVQLRRGLYALGDRLRATDPHPLEISNLLVPGSYVSLETALAHHGLIPEAVFVCTAVTVGRTGLRQTPFGAFVYRHIKDELFWGYESTPLPGGRDALVALPEKALLDLAYLTPEAGDPAYVRALRLQRTEALDRDRLADYARRFGSRKVARFAAAVDAVVREDAEGWETL